MSTTSHRHQHIKQACSGLAMEQKKNINKTTNLPNQQVSSSRNISHEFKKYVKETHSKKNMDLTVKDYCCHLNIRPSATSRGKKRVYFRRMYLTFQRVVMKDVVTLPLPQLPIQRPIPKKVEAELAILLPSEVKRVRTGPLRRLLRHLGIRSHRPPRHHCRLS